MSDALMRALINAERRLARLEADGSVMIALPLHAHKGAFPQPFTVNSDVLIVATPNGKRLRLALWSNTTFVVTTNTGAAYWTVSLIDSAATTLASFTTAADSADAWVQHAKAQGDFATNPLPTTDSYVYIRIAKTGAPGGLYLNTHLLGRISG